MKGKGLYAVFGVIAAAVVVGIIYFGTGANQQASIGALKTKTTTTVPTEDGVGPITTNPNDPGWTRLCRDNKPHLQVLSPNGGEMYVAGQRVTVTWRSCNIRGNVDISLTQPYSTSGFYAWVLGTSYQNSGQGIFTLPTSSQWGNMIYGKKFKVLVGNTDTQVTPQGTFNIFDTSNNLFTIKAPVAGAVVAELVSFTYNDNYNSDIGTHINTEITSNIRVTAQGSDMFIPRSVKVGTSLTDTNVGTTGFVIVPLNVGYAFDPSVSIVSSVSIMSGGIIDSSGRIKITKGQSANLRIVSVVTAPVGSGMKAIQLNALGAAEAASGALISYPTLPASAYRSGFTQGF
jgi:hypothetical protein